MLKQTTGIKKDWKLSQRRKKTPRQMFTMILEDADVKDQAPE